MELNPQKKILQGIVGSSWDKSIDKRKVIASGKGRHKLFRRTLAEATLQKKSSVVFNAGVSNWTWALSAFGRQGNILVNEDAQRLTLNLLGQDESILNSNLDTDMILDDDEISTKSLSQLEGILTKKPDNFHALLYSGIRLFEEGRYELAQGEIYSKHINFSHGRFWQHTDSQEIITNSVIFEPKLPLITNCSANVLTDTITFNSMLPSFSHLVRKKRECDR